MSGTSSCTFNLQAPINSIERQMIQTNVQFFYDSLGELFMPNPGTLRQACLSIAWDAKSHFIIHKAHLLTCHWLAPLLGVIEPDFIPCCNTGLLSIAGMCERIMRTPLPLTYTR